MEIANYVCNQPPSSVQILPAGQFDSISVLFSGTFQVRGPHETLVAMLGSEAELTCFLLPLQSVNDMKMGWTQSLPSQVMRLYWDGRDKSEKAM